MDAKTLESVCNAIYRQFPEVKGKRPKVQSHGETGHLLIFQGTGTTSDGKSIARTVRVTVTAGGKIGKITTSR
jgi:hypothetical protein